MIKNDDACKMLGTDLFAIVVFLCIILTSMLKKNSGMQQMARPQHISSLYTTIDQTFHVGRAKLQHAGISNQSAEILSVRNPHTSPNQCG